MVEIVGSVKPEDIPPEASRGIQKGGLWTDLARRAVADKKQGLVTMVQVTDDDELKRLRNGTQTTFKSLGYRLYPAVIKTREGDLRVWLELAELPKDEVLIDNKQPDVSRETALTTPSNNGVNGRTRRVSRT